MGLGDIFGSVVSGLFGLGTAHAQQVMSYRDNKRLQENQAKLNYNNSIKYAQQSALNNPTWNRAGLEKAGYNPMLAVQNATGGVNASSFAGSSSVQSPDYSSALSQGIANAQSFQRLRNETATADSTVETNKATARNQNAEASNKEAENPYISQREQKNLGKLDAETAKLNRETDYFDALEENMVKMRELQERLGFAGIDVQRQGVGAAYANANAAYANARAAQMSAEAKTLNQYLGKWTEDKFKSLKGSKFGKDLAKLGRMFYRR